MSSINEGGIVVLVLLGMAVCLLCILHPSIPLCIIEVILNIIYCPIDCIRSFCVYCYLCVTLAPEVCCSKSDEENIVIVTNAPPRNCSPGLITTEIIRSDATGMMSEGWIPGNIHICEGTEIPNFGVPDTSGLALSKPVATNVSQGNGVLEQNTRVKPSFHKGTQCLSENTRMKTFVAMLSFIKPPKQISDVATGCTGSNVVAIKDIQLDTDTVSSIESSQV